MGELRVWAPNAMRALIATRGGPRRGGDSSLGASGVWELYVPGVQEWQRYKYRILGRDGVWREKADPYAQHTEVPPQTASMVFRSGYQWNDGDWMRKRAESRPHQEPMSVYEVHLGSWRPGLSISGRDSPSTSCQEGLHARRN